jgi:hypothetical protein
MLYGSWLEKRVREYMAKDPAQANRMYSPHSWNRYIHFFAGNFRKNKTKMFRLPQTCTKAATQVNFFTLPNHTIPYHIPYPTLPYHTIPYHTVSHRTTPYRTVPYRTVPYHTGFYYAPLTFI